MKIIRLPKTEERSEKGTSLTYSRILCLGISELSLHKYVIAIPTDRIAFIIPFLHTDCSYSFILKYSDYFTDYSVPYSIMSKALVSTFVSDFSKH